MFILRYNENDTTKPLKTYERNKYWLYYVWNIKDDWEKNIYDVFIIESSQYKWFIFFNHSLY